MVSADSGVSETLLQQAFVCLCIPRWLDILGYWGIHGSNRPRKAPDRLHQEHKWGHWMPTLPREMLEGTLESGQITLEGSHQHIRNDK